MNEVIYVTFQVDVRDEQCGGKRHNAQCEITVPRAILDNLDPGDVFMACMKSALLKYDNPEEDE